MANLVRSFNLKEQADRARMGNEKLTKVKSTYGYKDDTLNGRKWLATLKSVLNQDYLWFTMPTINTPAGNLQSANAIITSRNLKND